MDIEVTSNRKSSADSPRPDSAVRSSRSGAKGPATAKPTGKSGSNGKGSGRLANPSTTDSRVSKSGTEAAASPRTPASSPAAKARAPKGGAAKGAAAKDSADKGIAAGGKAAPATAAKGTAAEGNAAKGAAAKGAAAKGTTAKGTGARGAGAPGATAKSAASRITVPTKPQPTSGAAKPAHLPTPEELAAETIARALRGPRRVAPVIAMAPAAFRAPVAADATAHQASQGPAARQAVMVDDPSQTSSPANPPAAPDNAHELPPTTGSEIAPEDAPVFSAVDTRPDPAVTAALPSPDYPPFFGELDLYLTGEGKHYRLWEKMGAHPHHRRTESGRGLRRLGAQRQPE